MAAATITDHRRRIKRVMLCVDRNMDHCCRFKAPADVACYSPFGKSFLEKGDLVVFVIGMGFKVGSTDVINLHRVGEADTGQPAAIRDLIFSFNR